LYQMPCIDVQTSVSKLKEAKSLRYRGVILAAWPSGAPTLTDEDDAFWAVAAQEGMPIHVLVGTHQAGACQKGEARDKKGKGVPEILSSLANLHTMRRAVGPASE